MGLEVLENVRRYTFTQGETDLAGWNSQKDNIKGKQAFKEFGTHRKITSKESKHLKSKHASA